MFALGSQGRGGGADDLGRVEGSAGQKGSAQVQPSQGWRGVSS